MGTSRSELFAPGALAEALCDGRIEACILDGAESKFASEGSPLQGLKNLFITPRLGSHTREARLRASWYVAHRMHEAISPEPLPAARLGNITGWTDAAELADVPGASMPADLMG